jgi:hypothetical protein
MPKKIKLGLRPTLDVEAMTVTMNVVDGKKKVIDSSVYHWADVPAENQTKLSLAGLSTVMQQRGSSIKEDPVAKLAYMDEVFEMFCEGRWEKEREGGARLVAPIIEVLAGLKGTTEAVIQKSWAKYDDEFKASIIEKYSDEIDAVKAKRAEAEEVDLDDLL